MQHRELFTIGYEGRTPDEFFRRMGDAGVSLLLDIRLRPNSRKPGFSKSALSRVCGERGIGYEHDRDLGTPADLLSLARQGAGYNQQVSEAYLKYLLTKEPSLKAATERSLAGRVCLLCYEADATDCHRKIVAEQIAKRTGATVTHL